MTTSAPEGDGRTLAERVAAADYAAKVCEAVARIEAAPDAGAVLGVMKSAVNCLGADAGVFTSFVRDDATNLSYRVAPANLRQPAQALALRGERQ